MSGVLESAVSSSLNESMTLLTRKSAEVIHTVYMMMKKPPGKRLTEQHVSLISAILSTEGQIGPGTNLTLDKI